MKQKKFVFLSKTNLAKVYEWSEKNEDMAIATAYLYACSAVGAIDIDAICNRLKPAWGKRNGEFGYIHEAYSMQDKAFELRDTIGRAILEMLKREESKK